MVINNPTYFQNYCKHRTKFCHWSRFILGYRFWPPTP